MKRYGSIQVERLPNSLIRVYDLGSGTSALYTDAGECRGGVDLTSFRAVVRGWLAGQPSAF